MPFVELIIVLFVILAVITRFLTLYLLRKYRKLREDFDNARRAQSSEAANLRRQIHLDKQNHSPALHLPPPPPVARVRQTVLPSARAPAPVPDGALLPDPV